MALTETQKAEVRRMVAEPDNSGGYTDEVIQDLADQCLRLDELGKKPHYWDQSTDPPTQTATPGYIPTYDLNAIAGKIWTEKAAALQSQFDFSGGGQDHKASQKHQQALAMARRYSSQASAVTAKVHAPAAGPAASTSTPWIANAAEALDIPDGPVPIQPLE